MQGFITDHWFLTFLLILNLLCSVRVIIVFILRTIKVLCRGWPPPHLDADGDWKPLPKVSK